MDLTDYGFDLSMLDGLRLAELGLQVIPARVTAVHKERYEIICEHGLAFAKMKASVYFTGEEENFPTTGDFVLMIYNEFGESQIIKTLPRKSYFSRRDPTPGRGEQAVAANFDYVFIMQSLNFDFNLKRLERYITLAWQSGATPVIILTKADLVESLCEQIAALNDIAMGLDILAISALTGEGLENLEKYMIPGKTIVFLGSSGVGKSSLVNALTGTYSMLVKEIREEDSRGRHTTTHRQLIMLDNGVMVIDTPGMRELGMWDVSTGLGEAFGDVEEYFAYCKFKDCTHNNEPGCAVKAALANGDLSVERWNSYLKLKREAKYTDNKGQYLQQKHVRQKEIAKGSKQRKKRFK